MLARDRTGDGVPVVLIHGLGSRRQIWAPIVGELASRGEVFALDLPGFGESALPGFGESAPSAPLRTTVPGLVDSVAEFLAENSITDAHLVGNSLGGGIALELGRRALGASVTAFSPIGFWHDPGRIWCQRALGGGRTLGRLTRPALPLLLESATVRALLVGLVLGRPRRASAGTCLADLDGLINAPGYTAVSASFADYRFDGTGATGSTGGTAGTGGTGDADDLGGLASMPITIAWGRRDLLLTYSTQHRRARAQLPGARHLALPGCGHTPFYDDPSLCARVVLDALEVPTR